MKLAFEPVIPSLIVLTPWLRMFHRPDRTVVTTRMRGHHGTPKASRAVTLRLWGQRWSNRSMARAGSGRRHPGGRVTIRTRSKERTTRGRPSISFSLSLADMEYDVTIRGGRGSVLPRDVAGWPAPRIEARTTPLDPPRTYPSPSSRPCPSRSPASRGSWYVFDRGASVLARSGMRGRADRGSARRPRRAAS